MVVDADAIKAMKVVELKAELSALGLPVTGKKDELVERLLGHQSEQEQQVEAGRPELNFAQESSATPIPPISPITVDPVLDEASKRALRAERFGIPMTEEARRLARQQRFGLSAQPAHLSAAINKPLSDGRRKDNKKGIAKGVKTVSISEEELVRLKARQERFGGELVSSTLMKAEESEAKARRLARFGPSK